MEMPDAMLEIRALPPASRRACVQPRPRLVRAARPRELLTRGAGPLHELCKLDFANVSAPWEFLVVGSFLGFLVLI